MKTTLLHIDRGFVIKVNVVSEKMHFWDFAVLVFKHLK